MKNYSREIAIRQDEKVATVMLVKEDYFSIRMLDMSKYLGEGTYPNGRKLSK